MATAVLVAGAWAGSGLVGNAGAESAAGAARGATVATYQRSDLARGDDPKVQALDYLTAEDATFHPLVPCRIVNTKDMASGDLAANEERSFLAISLFGDFVDQGGAEFDCGVPDTATAIHVNVTAVNPKAKGNLRLFPYGADLPGAALIAYSPGVNLSNAGTVKICREPADLGLCGYDFTVFASAATDVIVDVMGYYEGPMTVRVGADGLVSAASLSVLSVEKGVMLGEYKVTFDRNVSSCVFLATPDPHAIDLETGEVSTAPWSLIEPESVYIHTADSDGTWADHAFSLVVHC